MEQNNRCQILARNILDIFSREFPLDAATIHYLESSFGITDIQDLDAYLQDPERSGAEEILEFLFFPDTRQRLELEPLLQAHDYRLEDRPRIVEAIMRRQPSVLFVHNRRRLRIEPAPETVAAFVDRLNIHKQCDPGLKATLQATRPEADALRILVKIRSAPGRIQEQKAAFLQTFLRRFQGRVGDFWEYVDFLLRFLQEAEASKDLGEQLRDKLFLLENALKKAEQLEQDLRRHAVETLHMRRTSILALNRDQIVKEMAMAEHLLNLAGS